MPIPLGTKVVDVRPAKAGERVITSCGEAILMNYDMNWHWPILAPDNAYGALNLEAYLTQAQPGRELAEFREPNNTVNEEYVGLDGEIYWSSAHGKYSPPDDIRRIILKPLPKPKKRVLVIEAEVPEDYRALERVNVWRGKPGNLDPLWTCLIVSQHIEERDA